MCLRFRWNAKENQYKWLLVFFTLPSAATGESLNSSLNRQQSHLVESLENFSLFSICLFLNLTIVDDKVNDIDMHNRQHKILLEHIYFAHYRYTRIYLHSHRQPCIYTFTFYIMIKYITESLFICIYVIICMYILFISIIYTIQQ